ncbi:hypothetical protein [Actinopolymorpha pittospori]|uniref:Peptidase MA superfamily protein n=1 Tax=Actinopolymorpha pittospori TaxID=648752 RepID=A0A927RG76_9ACTN|nr:hypothetical protein [Actinopolymorpha pittospori]MBE1610905.1 hypothetical protein [Actinopolymorpha pittospori]
MIGDPPQRVRRHAATRRRAVVRILAVLACGGLALSGAVALTIPALGPAQVPSAANMRSAGVAGLDRSAGAADGAPMISGPTADLAAERVTLAGKVLGRQAAAVRAGDRASYLATIDPASPDFAAVAARTYDNLARMQVVQVRFGTPSLDDGALTADRRSALGPTAWAADVEMTFRLRQGDTQLWKTSLRMAFVQRGGRTYVAGDRENQAATDPMPLWLIDKVDVVRGKHSLVVGVGSRTRLERYALTTDRSVPRVTSVWGRNWDQYVVVLVPATQGQMERLIGADSDSQAAVAAVTTSVGRSDPNLASHIVINPRTFDQIGSLGRLVVLTHEATHVAANATMSSMPVWLSEGFADYVGFRGSGLASSVIAEEFLQQVRQGGAPDALPGGPQFDPQAKALDEAYESAWTACSYVAARWSQAKLVEFYVAMDRAASAADQADVYRRVLRTTEQDFVQGWREYVEARSKDG